MQWQAASRQQLTPAGFKPDKSNWGSPAGFESDKSNWGLPAGFEPDKSYWGWNWLERWMAVRPWENRFIDINLKDGLKARENESADAQDVPMSQLISTEKKPVSNIGNGKIGPLLCSNSNISIEKSATSPSRLVSSRSFKPVAKKLVEEATSRPNVGSRSHSNPRERSTLADKQGKKRLSLPAGGAQPAKQLSRAGVKSTTTAPKPVKAKNQLNGNHIKPTKFNPQTAH
ncbi:hypothetical protein DH2020_000516 [Rehmannia glutinosa]|uniref:Uncharacterized protein n=1 Tax=Rehmannia glutinosa TaxID=99300 RepID=A0ABR0XWV0_REHGL